MICGIKSRIAHKINNKISHYVQCHLYSAIFGGDSCLISGGAPVNDLFTRVGSVVTTSGTFGPDIPVTVNRALITHGEITETVPAYDISPIVRPTAPDTYSAPTQTWDLTSPENKWVYDLLGDGFIPDVDAPVVALGPDVTHDGTGISFEITEAMVVDDNPCTTKYNWDGGAETSILLPFTVTRAADTANHTLNVEATDTSENVGIDAKVFTYAAPAAFDYFWDFEETGVPATGTWASNGDVDFDYAIDPIAGLQSLRINDIDGPFDNVTVGISAYSEFHCCIAMKATNGSSGNIIFIKSASGEITRIVRTSDGAIYIRNPITYSTYEYSVKIPNDQVGYLWLDLWESTGSNGIVRCSLSSTKTKPVDYVTFADGQALGGINSIELRAPSLGTILYDNICVDSQTFTLAP